MRKTAQRSINNDTVTTTTTGLMQILCCGRETAIKIGKAAQARIQVGKRVLWHLPRIYQYLEQAATDK